MTLRRPAAPRAGRRPAAGLAWLALISLLAGCTGSDDPSPGAVPGEVSAAGGAVPTTEALPADDPIRRAEAFLLGFDVGGSGEDEITPESVVVLDYVARRWGRPQLADPEEALSLLDSAGSHPGYARLFDPEVELSPSEAAELDPVMGPALFCERHDLPPDYESELREQIGLGGYQATHVLLALVWLDELGCAAPGGEALRDDAIDRVVAELGAPGEVTDLSAEQIAFLDYAGALDRVDPGWEDALVSSQLEDGGWTEDPGTLGRWHTAGTAWWALLAFREPGDPSTRMLPTG